MPPVGERGGGGGCGGEERLPRKAEEGLSDGATGGGGGGGGGRRGGGGGGFYYEANGSKEIKEHSLCEKLLRRNIFSVKRGEERRRERAGEGGRVAGGAEELKAADWFGIRENPV